MTSSPFITERDRRNLYPPTVEEQKRRIKTLEDRVREEFPEIVPEKFERKLARATAVEDDGDGYVEPIYDVRTRNKRTGQNIRVSHSE